jgi:hypothetical protein
VIEVTSRGGRTEDAAYPMTASVRSSFVADSSVRNAEVGPMPESGKILGRLNLHEPLHDYLHDAAVAQLVRAVTCITATWRSDYAAVCKAAYPGLIPGVASTNRINCLISALNAAYQVWRTTPPLEVSRDRDRVTGAPGQTLAKGAPGPRSKSPNGITAAHRDQWFIARRDSPASDCYNLLHARAIGLDRSAAQENVGEAVSPVRSLHRTGR